MSAPARDSTSVDQIAEGRARSACPYLLAEDLHARRATAWRGHRCTAVDPAIHVALDKQRRLCLLDAHVTCATYLAARAAAGRGDLDGGRPSPSPVELEPVTRWSIVRTVPTVVEAGSPVGGILDRLSGGIAQVGLAVILVVALGAIALGQLRPGAGDPSVAPSSTSPSAVASPTFASPTPGSTPSPTVTPAPVPTATANASATYVVQPGDTLWAIAIHFGTTVRAIQDLNGLGTSTRLVVGQVLKIP